MCYPWLCARRYYLEFLNTSDLPRRKPLVIAVLPASLSTRSAAVVVVVFFFFSTALQRDGSFLQRAFVLSWNQQWRQ